MKSTDAAGQGPSDPILGIWAQLSSSPFADVAKQRNPSADVREPPTLEPAFLPILGFADPACSTLPITGRSPCAADCTGRLNVGMTMRFRRRGGRGRPRRRTPVAHRMSATVSARWHSAWSRTWRRLVGARCARTSPKRLRVSYRSPGGPLLTDPIAPRLRNASIALIRFCKKNAEPRQKQKRR